MVFKAQILDGRSRYKACAELERDGHPVELKRELFSGTDTDALAYVISMNVKRRHLSASQRALIAAKLVNSTVGGNHSVKLPNEINQKDVATLAGVAVKMVTDPKKVLDKPDLAKQVLNGTLAVNKAAKQVRDEENKAKGKGKKTSVVKKPKSTVEYITPHDGKSALSAYSVLEEHLLDALQDVNDKSSFTHADEYARETIAKLEEKLGELQPEEEEQAAA